MRAVVFSLFFFFSDLEHEHEEFLSLPPPPPRHHPFHLPRHSEFCRPSVDGQKTREVTHVPPREVGTDHRHPPPPSLLPPGGVAAADAAAPSLHRFARLLLPCPVTMDRQFGVVVVGGRRRRKRRKFSKRKGLHDESHTAWVE